MTLNYLYGTYLLTTRIDIIKSNIPDKKLTTTFHKVV